MINSDKYLYCDYSIFAYNQRLLAVDIKNKSIDTVGRFTTERFPQAVAMAAERSDIELIILEGNAAYLKKVADEIKYIDNNLKVEVNPYNNEISY